MIQSDIIKILLVVILSPILGCLLAGLDRKITAHLQGRVGPPILQPYYDFRKLLAKENFVSNRFQNLYILAYFIFILASLLMLVFEMDLLMIVFVFTFANIALIIGGMSTGSPYSKIGSQRETMAMLAYEPILVFYIVGMFMLTGSFTISKLNSFKLPLIAYLPLIFVCMLYIMLVKFKKSPFDFASSHHAHQELVKGIMTEFSGPTMAIIELSHWYETVFLLGLMFIFWKQNIFIGVIISIITYLFVIIVDNISARLYWKWFLKYTWSVAVVVSIANILVLYIYKIKLS
ncbi:MAG TPA: complex I subunit 1 family protein [Clostridiaceae bacterium]